jgi:hypothetical protein
MSGRLAFNARRSSHSSSLASFAKAGLGRVRTRRAQIAFPLAMAEHPDRALDLWVSGQEVIWKGIRRSTTRTLPVSSSCVGAMAADILLTL